MLLGDRLVVLGGGNAAGHVSSVEVATVSPVGGLDAFVLVPNVTSDGGSNNAVVEHGLALVSATNVYSATLGP